MAIAWTTENDLGARPATLTRNSTSDSSPFALFSTSARIRPSPALSATVGYRVNRWLTAEATGRARRSDVEVSIAGDFEGVPDRTIAGERLTEYAIDASAVVALPLSLGRRARPFVLAGFGYRRELHDERAEIDTGSSLHAGGGVKWIVATRSKGWLREIGVRGEARAVQRRGGFHLDRATNISAFAGGGVFFVF